MEVDKADDEVFNKWYNEEHVPERMAIPGYISARRFELDPDDDQANNVMRYLWHLGVGERQPVAVAAVQGSERQAHAHQGSGRRRGEAAGAGVVPADIPGRWGVLRPGRAIPIRNGTKIAAA